jgi:hypothetical protein
MLIFIGFYPVLVAFRSKNCLIYFLSAIYMWCDLLDTVYKQGRCASVWTSEDLVTEDDIRKYIGYWTAYKTINIIPTLFVASYITVNLSYRALVTFFDIITVCKTGKEKRNCILCDVDDETEIIYSHTDLLYVLDIFHKKDENKSQNSKNIKIFTQLFRNISNLNGPTITQPLDENEITAIGFHDKRKSIGHSVEDSVTDTKKGGGFKQKLNSIFRNFVYDWNPNFKFSSRFINTHVVAYIALYHFSMFILYNLIYYDLLLQKYPQLFDFNLLANLTIGDLLCNFGEDFCIPELAWPLPIPRKVVDFGNEIIPSLNCLIFIPFFGALLICTIQVFIGMRDTKKYLFF